jgi:hypothetical protein
MVQPDDWQAFNSVDMLVALVLQPAVLQALSIAATLDELTLQPDVLQAFSTAAMFAELTAHPDVLQAFTAAAALAVVTVHPDALQDRSMDAAWTDETGHPAALQAFTISAEHALGVDEVSYVAACATVVIETMTVRASATLSAMNQFLLREAFITDLRINIFSSKYDSDVTNITIMLQNSQLEWDSLTRN